MTSAARIMACRGADRRSTVTSGMPRLLSRKLLPACRRGNVPARAYLAGTCVDEPILIFARVAPIRNGLPFEATKRSMLGVRSGRQTLFEFGVQIAANSAPMVASMELAGGIGEKGP